MTTPPQPPARRSLIVRIALMSGVLVVVIVAGLLLYATDDSPGEEWVRVGAVEEIRNEGVVSLPDVPAYVLVVRRTPVALLARSPHLGERITYCPSWMGFEDQAHGAKFDRLGNYVLGPAPRGLDRLAAVVRDGVVWVNPNEVLPGPQRGSGGVFKPAGPFCSGGD